MCLILRAPTVPDKSNRDEKYTHGHRREAVFRPHFSISLFLFRHISIGEIAHGELADSETESESEICEARLACIEVVDVLEDGSECCEENVHVTVSEGAEERDGGDYWGEEEEF